MNCVLAIFYWVQWFVWKTGWIIIINFLLVVICWLSLPYSLIFNYNNRPRFFSIAKNLSREGLLFSLLSTLLFKNRLIHTFWIRTQIYFTARVITFIMVGSSTIEPIILLKPSINWLRLFFLLAYEYLVLSWLEVLVFQICRVNFFYFTVAFDVSIINNFWRSWASTIIIKL